MIDDDEGKKKKKSSWRILEFYSGIGGMAGIEGAEIVEAFDINDKANDVYQHNFGHRPSQGNIQTLTSVELDNCGADAWLMSPPCQPYTRQGLQKHSADARASSFIKIIELMPQMLHPPSMLFVENVVGFETSDTHVQLLKILSENSFATQEFILSPLQFGVPYSRPRYFCLAKRKPLTFKNPSFNGQLLLTPVPFVTHARTYSPYEEKVECESIKAYLHNTDTIGKQLRNKECDDSLEDVSFSSLLLGDIVVIHSADKVPVDYFLLTIPIIQVEENNIDSKAFDGFSVPPNLIDRWGSAMGILQFLCCIVYCYYMHILVPPTFLAFGNKSMTFARCCFS